MMGCMRLALVLQSIAGVAYCFLQPNHHHISRRNNKISLFATEENNSNGPTTSTAALADDADDAYDVVVIGSGIGGLSCAAMLAHYGYTVAVLESHYAPGGAAHGFTTRVANIGEFVFDTGPSFFSGLNPNLPAKSSNPLRTILDAIDEQVECQEYTSFGLMLPEGNFVHTPDFGTRVVAKLESVDEWNRLQDAMKPLAAAVDALPTAALRQDVGVALTAGPYLPNFATLGNPLDNLKLTQPFVNILKQAKVSGSFVKNWMDLLCFCLSGLPTEGTITAEMALMMGEFYDPDAVLDCPTGGAKSIVDALVRGIEKHDGSHAVCKSRVEKILVQDGRATGVQLGNGGRTIRANKAVVSNMSVWNLFGDSNLLDDECRLKESFRKERMETPVGKSFMHLHVGFRATREELSELQAHYMYLEDWSRGVEAEDNAVLVSIPSVHDDTLAPDGHAVLHTYTPATEEYERWQGMKRNSPEYKALKEERSQYLWKVLEKVIPDIRKRTVTSQVGTPLTHERFLNRYKGSYGPAIRAGVDPAFPFPKTPIEGLLLCGDSCFPGIGVPAVAGSGLVTANSVSFDSLAPQLQLLQTLGK